MFIKNKRIVEDGILKIFTKNGIILIDDEDEHKIEGLWFRTNRLKNQNNYIQVQTINSKTKKFNMLSRIIMNCFDKDLDVDHENHNTLDNRKENLRPCPRSQNNMNQIKRRNTSSKFKGVCFHKASNKWRAQARLNKKVHFLGSFDTELEAAKVYNEHAIKYYGEYALLNKV